MDEFLDLAKDLGYAGIAFSKVYENKNDYDEYLEEIENKRNTTDIDLVTSCVIDVESVKELRKVLGKVRQKTEVVSVYGGDLDVNRAAVEDRRVDVLLHPEHKRKDRGLDHKIAKIAKENDVAIGIVFHQLLNTYGKVRTHILQHMRENIDICNKYDTSLVTVSGAREVKDLRNPEQLVSLLKVLSSDDIDARKHVYEKPTSILNENRKKLSNDMVKNGVEKV